MLAQISEGRAESIPARQVETRLAPTEDPGDGAEVGETAPAGAARRARADMAALDCVDGRGLREKLDEAGCVDHLAIRAVADGHSLFKGGFELGIDWFRFARLHQRPASDAGEKTLQVCGGCQAVGVLLRDHLALFGNAHLTFERAGRLRLEKDVRGSCAAADGAAAAVEKLHLDSGLSRDIGELRLRSAKKPVAGENTAVLVAVAVADHDFLERAGALVALLLESKRARGHWMPQKFGQDA